MATAALVAPHFGAPPSSLRLSPSQQTPWRADRRAGGTASCATYELLLLLCEFDERTGWNNGFASCAHWLHWRTESTGRCARVRGPTSGGSRIAHRRAALRGRVRALTGVATARSNETALLNVAPCGTTAQTGSAWCRAWRRVDDVAAAAQEESRHLHRHLSTWIDDDGMVVIRGRLTPEVGAVVQRALEAAADRLFREAQATPKAERVADEVTTAQRRADALGVLAEAALTSDFDRGSAGDRYQVVLHLEAPRGVAEGEGLSGTVEVDHGAVDVSAETSRRFSCDASVVPIRHGADGAGLDVGRKTRTVPPSIRRALQARDRSCRFPGCTARRCDAHHLEHWIDGGATSLDNLVLLCRRHHRAVHEGKFTFRQLDDGTTTFLRPEWIGARGGLDPAALLLAARRQLARASTTFQSGTARRSMSSTPSTCSTPRPPPQDRYSSILPVG